MKMMRSLFALYRISSIFVKSGANTFLNILNHFFVLQFNGVESAASAVLSIGSVQNRQWIKSFVG